MMIFIRSTSLGLSFSLPAAFKPQALAKSKGIPKIIATSYSDARMYPVHTPERRPVLCAELNAEANTSPRVLSYRCGEGDTMAEKTMKCLLANNRDQIHTQSFLDSRIADNTSVSPPM